MVFSTNNILNNYNIIKLLGRGSYGHVDLIEHKETKEKFALKIINSYKSETSYQLLNEINIMKQVNSKYLIKIYDYEIADGVIKIIMEWAPNGDLEQLLKKHKEENKQISDQLIDKIIYQTACGIKDLHDSKIIHRDVKPSNILLFEDNNIKFADFGVSKYLFDGSPNAYTQIGTPYYMSPEILKGYSYSYSTDYWGLGCVYYQLVTLEKPFEALNILSLILKITVSKYNSDKIPFKYKNLIINLIKKDKTSRYDYKQIFCFCVKQWY
jgi:NIMA (never in mitosis gene a)-related kinase